MSDILHKVQMFLDTACQKQVVISDKLIDEFGEACKNAIRKQFTDKRPNKFTIRASNIGRPLCQLQMEKDGAKGESPPYSTKMRHLLGDHFANYKWKKMVPKGNHLPIVLKCVIY